MTDRFTEASWELPENNPYLYEHSMTAYGHPTITHLDGTHGHGHQPERTGPDCLFNCDPMPFGD